MVPAHTIGERWGERYGEIFPSNCKNFSCWGNSLTEAWKFSGAYCHKKLTDPKKRSLGHPVNRGRLFSGPLAGQVVRSFQQDSPVSPLRDEYGRIVGVRQVHHCQKKLYLVNKIFPRHCVQRGRVGNSKLKPGGDRPDRWYMEIF